MTVAAAAGGASTTVGLWLAVAWACAVAAVASDTLRRTARRVPERTPDTAPMPAPGASGAGRSITTGGLRDRGPDGRAPLASAANRRVAALGRSLRRIVGQGDPAASADGRDTDADQDAADRRTGWAALASSALLVVAPALAAAPVTWAVAVPVLAARRRRARREAALADQLPDVVDLLALTGAAGLPVATALVAIGARPGGPMGEALAGAGAHVRRGGSTGEALARLAEAGPAVRPLADALVQHDRYGTPLLPALQRVGIEARARRRRAAEEAARRLPVTLLFPLVLTTFPAFVLLTVVPLLAGSLSSLSLTSV